MQDILNFVARHDVGIGIAGTLVVIVGIVAGYGRRHQGAARSGSEPRS